jgi:hypothetical protein
MPWSARRRRSTRGSRVIGTAGSGKTQLALSIFRDAIASGRRLLYVCYNRPLVDHIALIAPPGGEVATYHQRADRVCRAQGEAPDFGASGAFAPLEAALESYTPDAAERFNELIVDEGRDFQEGWACLGGRRATISFNLKMA